MMGLPEREDKRGRPGRDGERGSTGPPDVKGGQRNQGLLGMPGEKGESLVFLVYQLRTVCPGLRFILEHLEVEVTLAALVLR